MNKIKISKAITYIAITIGLLVILGVYPLKLIRYNYQAKSEEVIEMESDPVSVENNMTQMFTGVGGELKSVDLYICNDMAGEIITFRMYDEEHKQIYEQFVLVDNEFVAPDFLNIPIRFNMEDGKEYSFIIEGLTTELYVAYEDRMTTTSPVNYLMAYGGEVLEDYDLVVRYNYACPYSIGQFFVWLVSVVVMIVILSILSKRFIKSEIEIIKLARIIANPVLLAVALFSGYILLVKRLFGIDTKNNLFLFLGVLLLLALIGYIVNFEKNIITRIEKLDIRKYLQIIAIATTIWYCYEYMNGLYDIFHYYSVTKLCIAFLFILIVTYDKKEILNIPNLIWLIAGPVWGYFYQKPYASIELEDELYRLLAWFWVVAGFVAINIVYSIFRLATKKVKMRKPDFRVLVPFAILLVLLCVFANGREWPFLLSGMCVLLGFRLLYTGKSKEFTDNLCLGIILNFYMMMWFSLRHRVYYFYQYYRYPMGYHTVTVTAYYLSMIAGAALIVVLNCLNNKSRIKTILSLCTLGFATSYLILTMSRTGFLSTGSMVVCVVILVAFVYGGKNKIVYGGKRLGIIIITTMYMFPITFMLTDLCPRLVNDPITFEFEVREWTFEEGMPLSDCNYMTIEQFTYEFGKKVFGFNDEWMTVSADFESPFALKAYAMEKEKKVIEQTVWMADDEEDVTDMSNGRIDIFKSYAANFNINGHEEMGVELPTGEMAYHAHNSFIQAIHDFGLIVGIYFIVFIVYIIILSIYRFIVSKSIKYDVLVPMLTIGFCAASMVEWLFHPCNPYGLVTFLCFVPMIVRNSDAVSE